MKQRRDERGYRREPQGGASVRADIVEIHVFRAHASHESTLELLQLRRARDPLRATWQPVLGHCEPDEGPNACALRELREEIGLDPDHSEFIGLWALEQVRPFYVHSLQAVVLGPRFAARVTHDWRPALNDEHDDWRWTPLDRIGALAVWPGQKDAAREIAGELLPEHSPSSEWLRILP